LNDVEQIFLVQKGSRTFTSKTDRNHVEGLGFYLVEIVREVLGEIRQIKD
jgi:hypothetical protein